MGVYSSVNPIKNNQQLSDEITQLAGQINAANYRFLKLLAEYDRREAWAEEGIRSCAHWLNWKCGIALGPAREKIRVARCLEGLSLINKAFSTGALSYSKVRAMTRVATTDNEEYLMMIAENGTASHMEKLVRKYKRVEHQTLPTEAEQQNLSPEESRSMVSYQDDDGMFVIHARLPAEIGSLVVKAIESIVRRQKAEEEAILNNEKNSKNVSAETFSDQQTVAAPLTFPQQRADALIQLAEHYIATVTNDSGIKSLAGKQRCQIMLHVDLKTLKGNKSSQEACCNIDNQQWISPEIARQLSCDASITTVMEDDKGEVLNIGRKSRTIPTAIHHALNLRDKSCRVPGCCSAKYLDAHHIKHWANGGETSLSNLVMLCRQHHRELHKNAFSIEINKNELIFITAKGKRMKESIYPQFIESSLKSLPKVTKDVMANKWRGEIIDYDMAVDGLLS